MLLMNHFYKNKHRKNLKYVPDKYKIQQMCDKVIIHNGEMLILIPYWYKDPKMSDNLLITMLKH